MTIASIPSPTDSVWSLGPVHIRAYALCIILGILVASYVMERRMRARGAHPYVALDVAVWAVPFGIVGARVYHVISSPQTYFGEGGHPLDALKIWEGGLGIWGAVAGGALGAWLAARQMGLSLTFIADTLAPGLALAQAIGRWGNWFNNELYGGRTDLPWGLKVHVMESDSPGQAVIENGHAVAIPGTYHPTFLYESLWNVGVAALVWWADRRFRLGRGRAFALYVMAYTAGRVWIEAMRTDPANHILGLRLNIWTAAIVFVGALVYFLRVRGPQEFVVPRIPAGAGDGGLGDGGGAAGDGGLGVPEDRADALVSGYRVVTEAEYRRYRQTGELPEQGRPDAPEQGRPDAPEHRDEDVTEPAASADC